MSYALSQDQINQLIVRIAQALGLTTADYSTLSQAQIDSLTSAVRGFNVTDVPTTRGTFTPVYQLVAGWVTDNSDPNNPGPIPGVDKAAWTFLRAGENVNQGNTLDAFMAREYTRIQYELRMGTDPGDEASHVYLYDELLGRAARSIYLDYTVKYLDDDGRLQSAAAEAQIVVGNCGRVLDTTARR